MLADFVSKRGGGLLMLGGRRAFAEGGWAGTPVAEVLPVEFDEGARGKNAAAVPTRRCTVQPTRAGLTYPVTQLAANAEGQRATKWNEMPEVSTVNPIAGVKPGATMLLTGTPNDRQEQVVLAYQRYGRGKALAFPIQDSWVWKMDATMAVDDRRTPPSGGGWCAGSWTACPTTCRVTTPIDRVEPGEPMTAHRRGRRSGVRRGQRRAGRRAGHVAVRQDRPKCRSSGRVSKDGEYKGTFVPDEAGLYKVKATATRGETDARHAAPCTRAPSAGDSEYFDAADARLAADAHRRRDRRPLLHRRPTSPSCPKPSATAAAASPSSKSAICGTCRSS